MRTVVENGYGINKPTESFEDYLRRKALISQEKNHVETDSKLTDSKSKFVEELMNQFCK